MTKLRKICCGLETQGSCIDCPYPPRNPYQPFTRVAEERFNDMMTSAYLKGELGSYCSVRTQYYVNMGDLDADEDKLIREIWPPKDSWFYLTEPQRLFLRTRTHLFVLHELGQYCNVRSPRVIDPYELERTLRRRGKENT